MHRLKLRIPIRYFIKILTKGGYIKVKTLIEGIGFISLTAPALAQSVFTGFYGQASTGYESNQLGSLSSSGTKIPNANSDTKGSAPSQNFGGAPLVFGAGYYWQASDKWLIGVGVDYSALSQTSSTFSTDTTNAPGNTEIVAGERALVMA